MTRSDGARARWALLLALLVLLGARTARADVGRAVVDRHLANGLRVVVSSDPVGADVSLLVRYDTGARDEPAGLEGLAHLVEHVMFTGS
jgi:zinc protease